MPFGFWPQTPASWWASPRRGLRLSRHPSWSSSPDAGADRMIGGGRRAMKTQASCSKGRKKCRSTNTQSVFLPRPVVFFTCYLILGSLWHEDPRRESVDPQRPPDPPFRQPLDPTVPWLGAGSPSPLPTGLLVLDGEPRRNATSVPGHIFFGAQIKDGHRFLPTTLSVRRTMAQPAWSADSCHHACPEAPAGS